MRNLFFLAVLALITTPAPSPAADIAITGVSAVTTSGTSASTAAFDCGIQVAIRCTGADTSYRYCDTSDTGSTCTAVVTDQVLNQSTTYDIGIPAGHSSAATCKLAFITAGTAGSCSVKNVLPRSIPATP